MIARFHSQPNGFSLVEVVLAIGMVSFSVLATVGLLSVGNETNKRARDEGFAAQIASNEFSRLRSLGPTTFPSPIPATVPSRFFDSEMNETTVAAREIYELRVNLIVAPLGTADVVVNAEVRNPPLAANPNISRFTVLLRIPEP